MDADDSGSRSRPWLAVAVVGREMDWKHAHRVGGVEQRVAVAVHVHLADHGAHGLDVTEPRSEMARQPGRTTHSSAFTGHSRCSGRSAAVHIIVLVHKCAPSGGRWRRRQAARPGARAPVSRAERHGQVRQRELVERLLHGGLPGHDVRTVVCGPGVEGGVDCSTDTDPKSTIGDQIISH